MLMAVQGPYALMVQPDDILISPREVDENFGTMVCFHPRYALGDSHNYMDKDDFLREMYLNTVGNDARGMERYENMVNMVWSRKMTGPNPDERAVDVFAGPQWACHENNQFSRSLGQRAGWMDLCFQRGRPKGVWRRKNDRCYQEKGGGPYAGRSGGL